jgi:predicted transcriptional regulator
MRMKLQQVLQSLPLELKAGGDGVDTEVTGGYAGDLLSCAMAGSAKGHLWVTVQGHLNVVAVASLNDLAGVIVAEGKPVAPEALAKADDEGIPILSTELGTFEVVGRLWDLGIGK